MPMVRFGIPAARPLHILYDIRNKKLKKPYLMFRQSSLFSSRSVTAVTRPQTA
jgi:hypothetical protein